MSDTRIRADMQHPQYGTVEVYQDPVTGEVIGIVEDIDNQVEAQATKRKKPPVKKLRIKGA